MQNGKSYIKNRCNMQCFLSIFQRIKWHTEISATVYNKNNYTYFSYQLVSQLYFEMAIALRKILINLLSPVDVLHVILCYVQGYILLQDFHRYMGKRSIENYRLYITYNFLIQNDVSNIHPHNHKVKSKKACHLIINYKIHKQLLLCHWLLHQNRHTSSKLRHQWLSFHKPLWWFLCCQSV